MASSPNGKLIAFGGELVPLRLEPADDKAEQPADRERAFDVFIVSVPDGKLVKPCRDIRAM